MNGINLQFYFAYCDAFSHPHPPTTVIVFTFIQANLHLIEVSVVFGACELLKNKVLVSDHIYPSAAESLPFSQIYFCFLTQMNEAGRILLEIYNKKFSLDLHRSVSGIPLKWDIVKWPINTNLCINRWKYSRYSIYTVYRPTRTFCYSN